MGLLTLFLHHRKSWLGISKVSLTSLEGLGLLSATSILGLCYAYPTPTLRPCYDIATTYERRRNEDLILEQSRAKDVGLTTR